MPDCRSLFLQEVAEAAEECRGSGETIPLRPRQDSVKEDGLSELFLTEGNEGSEGVASSLR